MTHSLYKTSVVQIDSRLTCLARVIFNAMRSSSINVVLREFCFILFFFIKMRSIYIAIGREFSLFLSLSRTHQKCSFCVAMISRTESQKILIETGHENIDMKFIPFDFQFSVDSLVSLQGVLKKVDFDIGLYCFHHSR